MFDVSVIIPTRNRPELLKRAITSVQKQVGAFSRECIVIDDGPACTMDSIRAIAEEAEAHYLSTGGNGGLGGAVARNRGVAIATGRYIAFLDDDDTWMEDKLQLQLTYMEQCRCPVSYTGMYIINKQGKSRYSFRSPPFDNHFKSIMRRNFIGTTSTVIVEKKGLDDCGGFDAALPALQDYDLYIRLLKKGRVGLIDEPLTSYYTELTRNNVSAGRMRFNQAVAILSRKYADEHYYYLLRRYFVEMFLLKCFRSPQFLSETVGSLFGRHR